ncbi:MAG: outer membrane protein assembly factor BamA [Prevotellaceae bacterium]|jgi:outer membrane protein insertion porin family|nr:outer membrane protein assembly factor BamA [Prevotellaceae bacterium]
MRYFLNIIAGRIILIPVFLFCITTAAAQPADSVQLEKQAPADSVLLQGAPVSFSYNDPQTYVVADVTISGVKYYTTEQILSLVGLSVGDTVMIPSDQLSQIARKLWGMRYFSDISITAPRVVGDRVYLNIHLAERPRVSLWSFSGEGVKKSAKEDLAERLKLRRGSEYSEYVVNTSIDLIKKYYAEKGYLNAEVNVIQQNDTVVSNAIRVTFDIDRKSKVKIKQIDFEGNTALSDGKLARAMKKTKANTLRNFFSSKKFNAEEFENDKENVITAYNEKGYRDAQIIADTVYTINEKRLGIKLTVDEGKQYYFRDIIWVGNTKLPSEILDNILGIEKGDVYDRVLLEKKLSSDQASVSTWYSDNGYLFFQVDPVEVAVDGDSIDFEMRMYEGEQAVFKRINITGNVKTNERVIRRELYTKPGYLWSRTAFERSLRELASAGNFEPEKVMSPEGFRVVPNPQDNTVDLTYILPEKSNDQLELSGGWGGNTFVGTVGVRFANFSIRRFFKKNAWRPVPSGDAQTLALRLQIQGTYYTAFSLQFVEPWLGGRKPTSLSVTAYFTRETNASYYFQTVDQWMETLGLSAGIGTRLQWPDSYFQLYNALSFQRYSLYNWPESYYGFSDGLSHNINYNIVFSRNSTDQPFYPRKGSEFSLGLQITPPYSLFRGNVDYSAMTAAEKYKWIEYHKWSFKGALYTQLVGDLVMFARVQFGYLGFFKRSLGYSPFEGFILGGDGMSGYNRYGQENIALRGYANSSITPIVNGAYAGHVYDKFTLELRHPVIMEQQASIYACLFLEGGNAWSDIKQFNPFAIKRAAGVGVKVMLPIVGILGIDWGYGFDTVVGNSEANGSNFAFTFGMQF